MHLKNKKNKIKKINLFIISVIFLVIGIIYILNIFNKYAKVQVESYSSVQTKRIVSLIINGAVNSEVASNIDIDKLFITSKDNYGNITSIDFNSKEVNNILAHTSKVVEKNLYYLKSGDINKLSMYENLQESDKNNIKKGIFYELPSGIIFNNVILSNILPKIPVKLDVVNNIFCVINTSVESYGLNNALLKVNIDISVDVKVLMPIISNMTTVTLSVPIIMKVIQGKVPSYLDRYLTGYSN